MNEKIDKQEKIIVLCLAILAGGLAIIQNMRVTTLVDYSYMVENSYRIYCGQMPYRDFVLMYPVGSFLLIDLFWKVFGLNNISIIIQVVFIQVILLLFV